MVYLKSLKRICLLLVLAVMASTAMGLSGMDQPAYADDCEEIQNIMAELNELLTDYPVLLELFQKLNGQITDQFCAEDPAEDPVPPTCSVPETPTEAFEESDEPYGETINGVGFNTPWGYDRPENSGREYPILVELIGETIIDDSKMQQYPMFRIFYQTGTNPGKQLAGVIDDIIDAGYRIDTNRIYLSANQKNGNGAQVCSSYIQEFAEGEDGANNGKYFAGVVRIGGYNQSPLSDEIMAKTSIWFHTGLEDPRYDSEKEIYNGALEYWLDNGAEESGPVTDSIYQRDTWTLTNMNQIEVVKYSEYPEGGINEAHATVKNNDSVFNWLFSQTLECR